MARVQVIAPDGTRGTVDEKDIGNLPDGARVLTAQEIAEAKLEAEYAQASTASKISGVVTGIGARNPQLEAFHQAAAGALTAGVSQAVTKEAADAIAPGAGRAYAERLVEGETAYPGTTTAGTATGIIGGAAIGAAGGAGAGAGAARALPMNALAAGAAPIEHGVTRALGGLAARGALGKAATQGAAMAVRGVAEGAAYAGVEQTSHAFVHDEPKIGEKLAGAVGNGALFGGILGGGLGFGGSLLGSGARSLLARGARAAGRVPELPAPRGVEVPFIDADAGLKGPAPAAEDVFSIGAERRPIQLRPGGRPTTSSEQPISLTGRLSIDPDAGLHAPRGKVQEPIFPSSGDEGPLRLAGDLFRKGDGRMPATSRPVRQRFDIGLDADADLPPRITRELSPDFVPHPKATRKDVTVMMDSADLDRLWQRDKGYYIPRGGGGAEIGGRRAGFERFLEKGEPIQASRVAVGEDGRLSFIDGRHRFSVLRDQGVEQVAVTIDKPSLKRLEGPASQDAFRLSSAKQVPHGIDASLEGGLDPIASRSPIKLPDVPTPGTSGLSGSAVDLARDQAWKAVGAGFGLQTTRYAKEAAKYFPNGTRDLGEVAIRFGLLDMGEAGQSPLASAWQAAKSGTPAEIAVRAASASDEVGSKIGAITEASGARVRLSDLDAGINEVRRGYNRIAGNEHVVGAIDNYAASLRSKLRTSPDGTVSLQDLLEQRKGLDDIVYRETKTLDPGRRVAALREVRSRMESVLTDALDEASGQVPGSLRSEYQTLKKDYHALRILTEAAEDSAARSSKGATFGLGEKFAIASSVASGNLGAAPILALGGKMIRERGNAAAAAFLSRAAEQGTFKKLVQRFDEKIQSAAAGALTEGKPSSKPSTNTTQRAARAAASREQSRKEARAKQEQAQKVVQWVGDHSANPERALAQVEEAAAIIGRSAGPRAAEGYSASVARSIAFLAAHIPIKERRDPLDPRSTPPLTHEEADRLLRAARYASEPMQVFDDFERGIITPEGLRAANTLVPESFEEFQLQLMEHVQNHMLRNKQLTQTQRLRVDKLLGFPAGPDLRPKAIARLQANFAMNAPEEGAPSAGQMGGGPQPPMPIDMNIQQSGFDAVEARMAG